MNYFLQTDFSGITNKTIILDVDGTICQDDLLKVEDPVKSVIAKLKETNQIYLFSNKPSRDRTKVLAEELGINFLNSPFKKPNKKVIESLPQQHQKNYLVVGDKFVTDGLLAKNIGATFIKVKNLTGPDDGFFLKTIYFIDNIFYKLFF